MKNASCGHFLLFDKLLADEQIEEFLRVIFAHLYPKDTYRGGKGFYWEYIVHRNTDETLVELQNDTAYLYSTDPARNVLPQLPGVEVALRLNKPSSFWTVEERAEHDAEKKRIKEYSKAITIRAIQQLALYKMAVGDWRCKPGDFILTFVNRRMRKAFRWINGRGWIKHVLPCKSKLAICSPLEFTIATGTTFAKTVEEQFGLEIEGREARGEKE